MASGSPTPYETKVRQGSLNVTRDKFVPAVYLGGKPTAPSDLAKAGIQFWNDVYSVMEKWPVLAESDLVALSIASQNYQRYSDCIKQSEELEFSKGSRLRYEAAMWLDKVIKFLKDCGMTPADRQKVSLTKEKKDDDWEKD